MTTTNLQRWKKVILIPVAIAGLLAAGYLVGRMNATAPVRTSTDSTERTVLYWRAPMDPTEIYDGPGKSRMGMELVPVYSDETTAGNESTQERTILYWRAPMDPTEIYDEPGKSRMGMDLVPVYDDEVASSGGVVSIDPVTVQSMGVRSEPVRRMDFSRTIRTVGEVQYDEESLYLVNAKVAGWIEKLHINFVGEEVEKGDPLLELYSPELVSTQQEYLLALSNYRVLSQSGAPSITADAERLLSAAKQRLEFWDIPVNAIASLERTGEVSRTILLEAPASGVVVKKSAIEGAHISAGTDLFEIADLGTVWVHASFYDNEVPWIGVGQSVKMELSYLPGKAYSGRVSYVYPFLREKARDVHVRLIFSNPDLDLKPGMYANVELDGKVIRNALVVPTEAVIRSGARTIVFVIRGEGRFEPREVTLGGEGGPGNKFVQVLGGLTGEEEIVTSAQFMLDSESRLQEAIQKMLNERSQSSGQSSPATSDEMPSMSSNPATQSIPAEPDAMAPQPISDSVTTPVHEH